jgi:predicted RND superfamily exporter protein
VTKAIKKDVFRTTSQWVAVAVCAILGVALFAFVDLTPAVEGDFFFSTDDPQLQGSKMVEQQFGSAPQIFIAARSEQLFSRFYLQRIRRLTDDLGRVDGVIDVRSLTRGPEDLEDIWRKSVLVEASARTGSLRQFRRVTHRQRRSCGNRQRNRSDPGASLG